MKLFLMKEFTMFLSMIFPLWWAEADRCDDDDFCRLWTRLVNKECKKFVCTPRGISPGVEASLQLCRSILLNNECPPQLQKVVFRIPGRVYRAAPEFIDTLVGQQHANLQTVKLELVVDNADLCAMARSMPNLKYAFSQIIYEICILNFKHFQLSGCPLVRQSVCEWIRGPFQAAAPGSVLLLRLCLQQGHHLESFLAVHGIVTQAETGGQKNHRTIQCFRRSRAFYRHVDECA